MAWRPDSAGAETRRDNLIEALGLTSGILGISKEGALGASGILKSNDGALGASGILKDGASGACAHIDQ